MASRRPNEGAGARQLAGFSKLAKVPQTLSFRRMEPRLVSAFEDEDEDADAVADAVEAVDAGEGEVYRRRLPANQSARIQPTLLGMTLRMMDQRDVEQD